MYTFHATYDEDGAAHAERAFYLRSVTELRRWSTFGPPVFLAALVAVVHALGVSPGLKVFFWACFAMSVVGPVFFYFARPLAAKRLARKHPVRHVALTPSAVEITAGDKTFVIAWSRINHVWSAGDYLLLVLGKFVAVSIPRGSLPPGANEFIIASTKHAT
jgi:hypothetical protein